MLLFSPLYHSADMLNLKPTLVSTLCLPPPPHPTQDLSWSDDGLYLCTVSDGAVYTWHMEGFRRCVRVETRCMWRGSGGACGRMDGFLSGMKRVAHKGGLQHAGGSTSGDVLPHLFAGCSMHAGSRRTRPRATTTTRWRARPTLATSLWGSRCRCV